MPKCEAILYVPSDTPDAMALATKRVAGVPLIVRGIMTLAQAGIEKITLLIAETQRENIVQFLKRFSDKQLPEIEIIHYDEPYRVSSDIVRKVGEGLGKRCLLMNANLLFEKELIEMIRSAPAAQGEVILCQYGIYPLPLIGISAEAWASLWKFADEKPRSIESCLKYMHETLAHKIVQKPAAFNTFLVKRNRDRAVAEKFLMESIRHSTMGPVAKHINKRISLPISLVLAKLWITPNAITVFNIIIGLFSGVFVADGHRYDIILFGAALFQIASIVDGCDGEVAKLTFRCSKFGQYIDSISDNLSLASFLVGLIAGYWRHTHSYVTLCVGVVVIVTTGIIFFWMIRFLKNNTQSASFVTFDKEYLQKLSGQPRWLILFIKYGKYLLKKDMFSFMFLIFAIAGVMYWLPFVIALGTSVGAVILTYLGLQTGFSGSMQKVREGESL